METQAGSEGKSAEPEMFNPILYRINEDQSDMRGVKEGWYAMDEKGKLTLGPFSSRDDCLICLKAAAHYSQDNNTLYK